MSWSNAIKTERMTMGMTQAEFGAMFYVVAMTVSYWERGLYKPELSTRHALCKRFGWEVSMFDD